MKAKGKLDKTQLKSFCVENVEKFVFGAMVLMALLLCWSALGLSPYKGTPDDLKKKANDLSQRIQSSTPPEAFEDLPAKRNLNGMLRRALANVNPQLFPMSEISRPYADRKVRRQQPKLLAVLDLKASSSFGAIATSEQGGRFATRGAGPMMGPEGNFAGPGMIPGGDFAPAENPANYIPPGGMPAMPGMEGMMPGMEGMMPGMEGMMPGRRGRAKPKKKPVEKPKPKAAPEPEKFALDPPSGAKLEGKYWVSVVGLIPSWDQEAEFQKTFRDATKAYPTDMPEYITCEVERAEVVSPGEASEFEPLDMDAAFEFMGKWAAEYPDVVDPKYLLPSLDVSEPLPPLVFANHDPNAVRHPKIPLKDEASAAAAKEAEAAAKEAEDAEKKKPRRARLRGRAGSMPGAMPGMGEMPGMAGGMDPMGMMGPGGRFGMTTREKIEHKLFRFFDFNVEPGKTYKYRVRLVLANPNYGKPKRYLADPKLADEEVLYTDWSEQTSDVFVPLGSELLAGDVNPSGRPPSARVMVRQFDQANAITAVHVFELARGDTANAEAVKVPAPPKVGAPNSPEEQEVDFKTNATVVDFLGGDKLIAGTKGKMPGRVLVMRADGELSLLNQFADATRFDNESLRLQEFKDKQSGKQNPAGMPAGAEPAGPTGNGFGNFFQDPTPPKKKR